MAIQLLCTCGQVGFKVVFKYFRDQEKSESNHTLVHPSHNLSFPQVALAYAYAFDRYYWHSKDVCKKLGLFL